MSILFRFALSVIIVCILIKSLDCRIRLIRKSNGNVLAIFTDSKDNLVKIANQQKALCLSVYLKCTFPYFFRCCRM